MLRSAKCASRLGEARPLSLRRFSGIAHSKASNRGIERKSCEPTLQGGVVIKAARGTSVLTLELLFLAGMALAQTDPGVQSGNRGTRAALSSVASNSPSGIFSFFTDGQARFQAVESVSGSPAGNNGLGPRFNSNS